MPREGELRIYSEEEIRESLKALPDWQLQENCITREYSTKNWREGVILFNIIAGLAEAHWHHPDVEVSFKRVKVRLTTHEMGGITERDFQLATEIEKLAYLLLKR
ncbi:MAG: 4a-hydroxytetrahydrobiopterin dehydratase [Aquificaceae bacterium]